MDEFKKVFVLAYSSPLVIVGMFVIYAMFRNRRDR
jgi:hypothetical protein